MTTILLTGNKYLQSICVLPGDTICVNELAGRVQHRYYGGNVVNDLAEMMIVRLNGLVFAIHATTPN